MEGAREPRRRRHRVSNAQGVEGEEQGEGVFPPQPTRGFRERLKLQQRGPRRWPKTGFGVLVHSELEQNKCGEHGAVTPAALSDWTVGPYAVFGCKLQ